MVPADPDTDVRTLAVLNPYDLSPVDTLPETGAEAADAALADAAALFRDRSAWLPVHRRLEILDRAATLMEERAGHLAEIAVREGGKPVRDTRAEIADAVASVRLAAAALRTDAGDAVQTGLTAASGRRMAFTRREPVGVVFAVGAFHHPVAGPAAQIAPAVAAGCPVLVRPAPETPLSCLAFLEVLAEAGLPREWAQPVVTSDDALVARLAADPRLGFLLYAGDAETGWRLRAGLASGVRCALDHGGAAPVIVAGDIDVYEVREALLAGCFGHAGQMPSAVQRIYAHTKVATRFATQLAMKAAGLLIGDPMDGRTDVGPMIRPSGADRVHDWVREAVDGGGQLLTGGEWLSHTLYAPTVIFNPPRDCRLMTEQVSGPVVCVEPWFKVPEALARANASTGNDRAAVFTRDVERAMEFADELDASAVMINDHPAFRLPSMPAAGRGRTGLGPSGVAETLRALQSEKTIVLRTEPLNAPPDAEPA